MGQPGGEGWCSACQLVKAGVERLACPQQLARWYGAEQDTPGFLREVEGAVLRTGGRTAVVRATHQAPQEDLCQVAGSDGFPEDFLNQSHDWHSDRCDSSDMGGEAVSLGFGFGPEAEHVVAYVLWLPRRSGGPGGERSSQQGQFLRGACGAD
ncbi:hypothetical protein OCG20_26965 [Streptomyces sp. G-5]|nr:hypothetical protein [Streptomyces sp. G-5]MCU4750060.1 hypothetical protein [Streptomyces sp. G-5]